MRTRIYRAAWLLELYNYTDHALVATRRVKFVIFGRHSCSRDHLRHKLTFFPYADFANLLTPNFADELSIWAVVI